MHDVSVAVQKRSEPLLQRRFELLSLGWWRRADGRPVGCPLDEVCADQELVLASPLYAGIIMAEVG